MFESEFRILWAGSPAPLSRNPIFSSPPACLMAPEALNQEVLTKLGKEAISEVPPPFPPGCYGRFFVVPKSRGLETSA